MRRRERPDERLEQPQRVDKSVREYLDMTKPRRRDEWRDAPRRRRPLIDNEGLGLEDGNDFA